MLSQEPQKTSEHCAPGRRDTDSRTVPSTELFPTSCAKEETSPDTTELEESQSMVKNLLMKTSSSSTLDQEFWVWPTLDQTPTDLNSSYAPLRPNGWTESMSSLDRLLKVSNNIKIHNRNGSCKENRVIRISIRKDIQENCCVQLRTTPIENSCGIPITCKSNWCCL